MRRPAAGGRPRFSSHRAAPHESRQRRRHTGRWRWMLSSSCASSATILATPAPGGSRRSRGRSDRSAASSAPIRDRRGLAASYGREAFRTRPADRRPRARPPGDRPRVAYAVRWLELGDGIQRPAWSTSRHRPGLTRPRRRARYPSRMRLSQLFFTTLRDDPADAEMPSHRLLAPGRLRPPARIGDLLAAAARQARQRPGRAGHPRGAGTRSAARRWRCRSSTRPTSGGRAAGTTRSVRSWAGSRIATAATWSSR